ncbi:hypothetical protein LX15_005033 [Streptoalloteichus tenebrarius]|uniref:Uncharacterized protein n=1 Tax=Streptoalloteichus tenebrarius (strain ATCC 17920 / DSM 40477 / JCM 4838 / CBS 697.72 / NBRC 16177 / NCIMB 11028 / NRRL B-12390 / A12253. 1 / ISP 5477) TaxID=1933 RepID=A0ABT1I0K2_STRSD|nr:hypothetical protein [Streptoalloteichus tenebrarius]MCP2261312.1 hypothetical protein [Streptoalloteichus tenebrarius]BFF03710.1 hypothetical protein GCM10020241_53850 [Streptoalloteichus tenebrarius]
MASTTVDVEKATAAIYADALLPVRERLGSKRLQEVTEEDVDDLVRWMLTASRKRDGKVGSGLEFGRSSSPWGGSGRP